MDEEMRREIFNPGGVSGNYPLTRTILTKRSQGHLTRTARRKAVGAVADTRGKLASPERVRSEGEEAESMVDASGGGRPMLEARGILKQ